MDIEVLMPLLLSPQCRGYVVNNHDVVTNPDLLFVVSHNKKDWRGCNTLEVRGCELLPGQWVVEYSCMMSGSGRSSPVSGTIRKNTVLYPSPESALISQFGSILEFMESSILHGGNKNDTKLAKELRDQFKEMEQAFVQGTLLLPTPFPR